MAQNVYFGASFASPYEVEQAVDARARLPAAVGLGLPAPRGHVRVPRGVETCRRSPGWRCGTRSAGSRRPRHCAWSAATRSTSTTSTPTALRDDRPRDRRPDPRRPRHADRRGARRRQHHRLPVRRRRLGLTDGQRLVHTADHVADHGFPGATRSRLGDPDCGQVEAGRTCPSPAVLSARRRRFAGAHNARGPDREQSFPDRRRAEMLAGSSTARLYGHRCGRTIVQCYHTSTRAPRTPMRGAP